MLVFAKNILQSDDYVPFHTHTALELVYYIEGSGTTAINKSSPYHARRHIYAIIPPNVPHDQRNLPSLHSICIGLNKSGLEEYAGCHEDTGGIIGQLVLGIMREHKSDSPGSDMIIDGLCRQLVGQIIRSCSIEQNKPKSKEIIISRTLQIIRDTGGMANVEELASQLMITPEYLRRVLKRGTGKNPQELISIARIHKAATLLRETSLPVNHISRLCGFDSPYYFSRIFSRKTGLSPTDYRNASHIQNQPASLPEF